MREHLALLEYFDGIKLTLRTGDSRIPCYACVATPCQQPKFLEINAAN